MAVIDMHGRPRVGAAAWDIAAGIFVVGHPVARIA